jgi:hypothetical protein
MNCSVSNLEQHRSIHTISYHVVSTCVTDSRRCRCFTNGTYRYRYATRGATLMRPNTVADIWSCAQHHGAIRMGTPSFQGQSQSRDVPAQVEFHGGNTTSVVFRELRSGNATANTTVSANPGPGGTNRNNHPCAKESTTNHGGHNESHIRCAISDRYDDT